MHFVLYKQLQHFDELVKSLLYPTIYKYISLANIKMKDILKNAQLDDFEGRFQPETGKTGHRIHTSYSCFHFPIGIGSNGVRSW